MSTDKDLLRRFANERDDSAFTELVRRRIDFVYAVALRQVGGDAHLAKDAAQEVFRDLAAKARAVAGTPDVVSWLYTATRFAAIDVRRRQARWMRRQEDAMATQIVLDSGTDPEWENLRPVLDEVIHELGEPDRTAIVLRYFENCPFAELGSRLGVAENTARMRVDRALDKLRGRLARHGIVSTAAALTSVLAAQPVVTAPPALATTVAASALAAAAGTASPLIAFTFMHTTKVVFGLASAAGLIGAGIYLATPPRPSAPAPAPAVVTAPLPPATPNPGFIAQIKPDVLSGALRFAAAGGTPEILVEAETPRPTVQPAQLGASRDYQAEALTPIVNRALRGGRAFVRGRSLFAAAGCASCHAFAGEAGGIGPDLNTVGGRYGVYEILQAILEPSQVISDLFTAMEVRTTAGRVLVGRVARNPDGSIAIAQSTTVDPVSKKTSWAWDRAVTVPSAEIAAMESYPVSPMPAGLISNLSEDEIADLIAYLISTGNPSNRVFQPVAASPAGAR